MTGATAAAIVSADTIAISPTKGAIGSVISFHGAAPSCRGRPGMDAEVFFLIGNFAGGSDINLRTQVEADPDSGAFSGSFSAPDPLASVDPRAPRAGIKTYPVSIRCLGPDGEHDGGEIVSDPPTFTYTDLVPVTRCDVYISFGLSSHSYSFNGRTGALHFKPGPHATRAVFTYHITNSRHVVSRPTKVTVYVQSRRPSAAKLNACKR